MKTTLTRLFTVALLMMISIVAGAQVKVLYGKDGEAMKADEKGTIVIPQKEQKEPLEGGTIIITQEDQKDGTFKVFLSVTPDNGYSMAKDGPEVWAAIPTDINSTSTRAVTASTKLDLKSDDYKDIYQKRTYYVTIDSKLALWVKSADFQNKSRDTKSGEEPETTDDGYSGLKFIANYKLLEGSSDRYSFSNPNPSDYYYLCPTDNNFGCYLYDNNKDKYTTTNNGQPFLTTYKCRNYEDTRVDISDIETSAVWEVKMKKKNSDSDPDFYYLKHKATGKYLTLNGQIDGFSKASRARVHLEAYSSGKDENMLFSITKSGLTVFICPQTVSDQSLNPARGNQNYLYGITGADGSGSVKIYGIVGIYNAVNNEDGSKWVLERAECVAPTISYNNSTKEVTISTKTSGATIYYTNGDDPADPTASAYDGTGTNSVTFGITGPTTIKAIAIKDDHYNSVVATKQITKVSAPVIADNGAHAISITSEEGSTIYYTKDGSEPSISPSNKYDAPLTDASNKPIRAIAVKDQYIESDESSETIKLSCARPVIAKVGNTFTITCSFPAGADIFYAIGDGELETKYEGAVSFTDSQLPFTVRAIAKEPTDYENSEIASKYFGTDLPGGGTSANPYLIKNANDFEVFVDLLNAESEKRDKYFKIDKTNVNNGKINLSGSSAINSGVNFSGTFDGELVTLSGLDHPLFTSINGGTVKNVMLDDVAISGGTNVGAICNEATGASRIYNCGVLATGSTATTDNDGYTEITSCSSTISGSNYVGGLVGLLDGSSRVINCFSYANITGGDKVGGIVGWNNVATNANSEDADHYLKTMVMNCMFYGDITGGSSKAPVYNGEIITNDGDDNGVNNFNYFWSGASYVQEKDIDVYNCALSAETRYLQRFEFFRHLLNSNRELAAWWATGSSANKSEMLKWVLEPSQLDGDYPFPILKAPGYYPSVVNIDAENASIATERNKGGKLTSMGTNGKLSVTISGATKRDDVSSLTFDLVITDKDPKHFNFNYGKVQLPYFNDYCTGNYTSTRVVTGWKITSITGGTAGSYTEDEDAQADTNGKITSAPYNFADRNCTNKDLYNTGGSYRVFNQGAYWDVPEGVTAITIQPYWGNARYVADACLDVVYKGGNITSNGKTIPDEMLTPSPVTTIGGGVRYTNGNEHTFTDIDQNVHSLKVYTSISEALSGWSPSGVYDYALVLVGNVHNTGVSSGDSGKKFTIMSVDFDHDNEPDYSYILRINDRNPVHPVRVDFLNIPGLGMAQKTTGGKGSYNLGIMNPLGWFESTNTSLFRVTQFEYDHSSRTTDPYIIQGGIFEQWVTGQSNGVSHNTTYFHLGGNVWFKEFHRGTHQDKTYKAKHPPVSITGGDFGEFYLTGLYRGDVANYEDNAECYINGGRFGIVAGAAMEGIGKTNGADDTGNIIWQIQNADIDEFYGGGLNATHPVEGSITSVITGGYIKQFCGGPKFGDMNASKTVKTTANGGCIFDTFFGAGFGGNSYSRYAPKNINYIMGDYGESKWNSWLTSEYTQQYSDNVNYKGVATTYSTQYLPMSNNVENVARLLIDFVSFSKARTYNVTSNLTNCTINKNFYGGGSLGKVDGPVTSTLTGCTVIGNVFGAGYSAKLPTVEVRNTGGFVEAPYFDENLGAYFDPKVLGSVEYEWEHVGSVTSTNAIDKTGYKLRTTENLDDLGAVAGKVTLNIANFTDANNITTTTSITGDVFGGGESSEATANVEVNISGGTVGKSVYGGGDKGAVGGNTVVTLSGSATITGNVFGGGNKAVVSGSATVNIEQ